MRIDRLFPGYEKIRSAVDVESMFDLVLYSLFLRKCEEKGLAACKEQYSLSYLSLIYGERVSDDDLYKYIIDLELELGIKDGFVSDGLKTALNRISDHKTVQAIFDMVYSASKSTDVNLAKMYDDYFDMYQNRIGRGFAEFGSNRSLAKLEAALLNARDNSSIYDGYCGSGMSIVESGNNSNRFYVKDLNRTSLSRAIMNLVIHDCQIGNATCGDSNLLDKQKYDYIVSEPPFSVRRDPKYLKTIDPDGIIKSKESIEIERLIGSLEKNGRAVILVTAGILFSTGVGIRDFRDSLIKEGHLEAIVALKPGAVSGTGASAMLLVIDKGNHFSDILMVDTNNFWEGGRFHGMTLHQNDINTICEIVKDRKNLDGVSLLVSSNEIYDNDLNMTPTLYVHPYNINEIQIVDVSNLRKREKELSSELSVISDKLERLRS